MKFGVCLPHRWNYSSKKNISRIAVRAEELGFDSLWVTDHIIVPETHLERGDTFFEALTTLSFVAGMTENILLGTAVLGVSPREPILLAKQIATIDALSEGRFILGVGTGWIEEELQTWINMLQADIWKYLPHQAQYILSDNGFVIEKEVKKYAGWNSILAYRRVVLDRRLVRLREICAQIPELRTGDSQIQEAS